MEYSELQIRVAAELAAATLKPGASPEASIEHFRRVLDELKKAGNLHDLKPLEKKAATPNARRIFTDR